MWHWKWFFELLMRDTVVTTFRLTLPYSFPDWSMTTQKAFDWWTDTRKAETWRNFTIQVISEACGWERRNDGERVLQTHELQRAKYAWLKFHDDGTVTQCPSGGMAVGMAVEMREATLGPIDFRVCGAECEKIRHWEWW
jgi:hypothetical protein